MKIEVGENLLVGVFLLAFFGLAIAIVMSNKFQDKEKDLERKATCPKCGYEFVVGAE